MSPQEYVCLAFSHDGAFLAAQGGGPEWNLAVWQWEKSKLSGVVKGVTQACDQGPWQGLSADSERVRVCIRAGKATAYYRCR